MLVDIRWRCVVETTRRGGVHTFFPLTSAAARVDTRVLAHTTASGARGFRVWSSMRNTGRRSLESAACASGGVSQIGDTYCHATYLHRQRRRRGKALASQCPAIRQMVHDRPHGQVTPLHTAREHQSAPHRDIKHGLALRRHGRRRLQHSAHICLVAGRKCGPAWVHGVGGLQARVPVPYATELAQALGGAGLAAGGEKLGHLG